MQIEGLNDNGAATAIKIDAKGNLRVSNSTSKYQNQVLEGNVFFAANQAAKDITVALATTYTGLCVSNPLNSGKNLVILKVSYALSVAPAAIAPIGLITGFSSTANVTHTNALTTNSCFLGKTNAVAKADDSATLTGSPAWTMPIMGGFTAGALPSAGLSVLDIDGSIVIPPGGYIAIGALTAVTGFGSIMWQEVSI